MQDVQRCKIIAIVDDLRGRCVKTARPFVREAHTSGVDGIKVIACFPEHYAVHRLLAQVDPCGSSGKTYRQSLERLRLSPQTLAQFREATDGLQLIVAPYDVESFASLADQAVDVWQIDPACNTNIPLLRAVADVAQRIHFCTRGCSALEVERALSICKDAQLVLIHSLRRSSAYGLLNDVATLKWLQTLGYPIGCCDDHLDTYPTCLGLAMGARVIEKPLWLDTTTGVPVSASSELARLVQGVRAIEQVIRSGPASIYRPEEIDEIEDGRTALVAARSIRRDTILTGDMLAVKAPALGLAPELLAFVLGQRVLYDLEEDDPITFGVIAQ